MPQRQQIDKDPVPPSRLDYRNKIGIACNQYDVPRHAVKADPGDIKADFYVHAFLFQVRDKVIV
jgi:hypothetical protein